MTPIENIGQIAIRARELPASVAFYRDALGLDYLFEAGPLAFLMCGDVRLMLAVPENEDVDHPSSTVYFRVADLGASTSRISLRSCPTTSSGWRSSATRTEICSG